MYFIVSSSRQAEAGTPGVVSKLKAEEGETTYSIRVGCRSLIDKASRPALVS